MYLCRKKRILGRRYVNYGSAETGKERPTKTKLDEMYFVPLSKVLRNFPTNPYFCYILDNNIPRPDILSSYRDGTKILTEDWRHNNHHHNILLYMDEVDMCDGLGSKAAGLQKI